MSAFFQQEIDALESRTLQLSLAPDAEAPLFSLPASLASALMLQPSKHYTIGVILSAFHTYILNHSLSAGNGFLRPDNLYNPVESIPYSARPSLAPAGNAMHIPYSAALAHLCRQLLPA